MLVQQASGRSWSVRGGTIALMVLESAIFAIPPFLLSTIVTHVISPHTLASSVGVIPTTYQYAVNLVLAVGAGVYEEFLFRMLIMGGSYAILKHSFKMEGATLYVLTVIPQALLFALIHHLPGGPSPLSWEFVRTMEFMREFSFRTLAGVYFAYLYQERGFGIAAGSHAFYDIIAVTLNTFR
jgi:membrane protease YdiL (CAAX protease family)